MVAGYVNARAEGFRVDRNVAVIAIMGEFDALPRVSACIDRWTVVHERRDPARIEHDLAVAGFNDIKLETIALTSPVSALDAAKGLVLGSPFRAEIERRSTGTFRNGRSRNRSRTSTR